MYIKNGFIFSIMFLRMMLSGLSAMEPGSIAVAEESCVFSGPPFTMPPEIFAHCCLKAKVMQDHEHQQENVGKKSC